MENIYYRTNIDMLGVPDARCIMYHWAQNCIAESENHRPHTDDCCEVYVNISGNVAFMVENTIYPVSSGDIIITNPFEYHRCIYLSNCYHDHYVLWIPPTGAEKMLSRFLNRPAGTDNLISFPETEKKQLLALCKNLVERSGEQTKLQAYRDLISVLAMIDRTSCANGIPVQGDKTDYASIPSNLVAILDYININYKTIKNVRDIAEKFYISHNTLGRLFKKHLNTTPYHYIEEKRFANAKLMLSSGKSITQACYESGFQDYSHFIAKFKKIYGLTPMSFKKKFGGV